LNNKCNATIKFDVSKGKVIYCWEDAGSYCCWHGEECWHGDDVAMRYWRGSVRLTWRCCWCGNMMLTWQAWPFATDVAVCCWRGRLLLTWPFAADVAVCCWRGCLLLTWLREGFFFQNWVIKQKDYFFFPNPGCK
jgi:hypothetical protein